MCIEDKFDETEITITTKLFLSIKIISSLVKNILSAIHNRHKSEANIDLKYVF